VANLGPKGQAFSKKKKNPQTFSNLKTKKPNLDPGKKKKK